MVYKRFHPVRCLGSDSGDPFESPMQADAEDDLRRIATTGLKLGIEFGWAFYVV